MIFSMLLLSVVSTPPDAVALPGGDGAPAVEDPADGPGVACSLSPEAFARRESDVAALFERSTATRELRDGYAFRFSGDAASSERLLAFINEERACCGFFTFELTFEPYGGAVWLEIGGSAEIKAFLDVLRGRRR